ncbi:MAG TPA: lipid-binding SYLF domain-containing protein [Opitutus sp.]|nr:lipid-binding SYLF domain-containing protein [Opitutus sp.]
MNFRLSSLAAGCTLALFSIPATAADDFSAGMQDVRSAAAVVQQMAHEPGLAQLLRESKGVLFIPNSAAGTLGGDGVLVVREHGTWSNPIFYNLGKVSTGSPAGGASGSLALILLSDRAANSFYGRNNFSLTAEAGLSIVNWSKDAQGDLGQGHDVVVWSENENMPASVSVGVSGVAYDRGENAAFYHRQATADEIMDREVTNRNPAPLQRALKNL